MWGAYCESLSACLLSSFLFSCSCLRMSNSEQSKQEHRTTTEWLMGIKRWKMCVCVRANTLPSSFVTPFFRYLVSSLILCLSCLSSTHEDTHHTITIERLPFPAHHTITVEHLPFPVHHTITVEHLPFPVHHTVTVEHLPFPVRHKSTLSQ